MNKRVAIAVGAIAAMALALVMFSTPAKSGPVFTVASDVSAATAGLASGAAGAFDVSCGTTATAISGMSGFNDVTCYTVSATSIFLGASNVGTSGFCVSTNTSNCGSNSFSASMDAGAAFCRVASGTVTLSCMGLK